MSIQLSGQRFYISSTIVLLDYKAYTMTEVGQTTTTDKHNCNHDHDSHHNYHLYEGDDHNMVHQVI